MLEFDRVALVFGKKTALSEVDLSFPEAGLFILRGPNGSGKTSLLRLAAGHIAPTKGEIRFKGEPIQAENPEWIRKTAFVPDGDALVDYLSVRDHALLQTRAFGLSPATGSARFAALASFFGIEEFSGSLPGELSQGTRKKLALSLALMSDPSLLLLDEPYNGLDAEATAKLSAIVSSFAAKGRLALVASHIGAPRAKVAGLVELAHGKAVNLEKDSSQGTALPDPGPEAETALSWMAS